MKKPVKSIEMKYPNRDTCGSLPYPLKNRTSVQQKMILTGNP